MSKLALGTAQFGMDYGIHNKRGKIPQDEIFKILNYAYKNDIDTLDTAYNYGDSEKIIGQFIKKSGEKFKIISKLPKEISKLDYYLKVSLKNLAADQLYGYLFHDFESFKNNIGLMKRLRQYKKQGLIKKIGFSLYYPSELEFLLKNDVRFDIVQVPYNILDQRFNPYFLRLKKKNIELHVRSVFLQGLLFKKPDELTGQFVKIKSKLEKLYKLSKNLDLPISAICLNFAVLNKNIDKIVIGVDSFENLRENIQSLRLINKSKSIYTELVKLNETDENIILPTKWK